MYPDSDTMEITAKFSKKKSKTTMRFSYSTT